MCVAMRCGDRSDRAIADWGRCDGQPLAPALGVTRARTPCAATLSHVLRQLDGNLGEATLGEWAQRVLTALAETMTTSETVDSGHGRVEPRRLTASPVLVGYRDWP